jgi:hypothetical protein
MLGIRLYVSLALLSSLIIGHSLQLFTVLKILFLMPKILKQISFKHNAVGLR